MNQRAFKLADPADLSIHSRGERDFADANDGNIPVNIFIHLARVLEPNNEGELDEDDDDAILNDKGELVHYKWIALADLFMPRKGFREGVYRLHCNDRDILVAHIQKVMLPLYETAIQCIKDLGTPNSCGGSSFYYWSK